MASLTDVETAFATAVKRMFPARDIVQGRRGEGAEPGRPFVMWASDIIAPIGKPKSAYVGADQVTTQLTRIEFVTSFDGIDAMGDALKFALCWGQSQRFTDVYTVAGFLGVNGPTPLNAPGFAKYQTRADIRVILSAVFTVISSPEPVETGCVDVVEESHNIDLHFCADNEGPTHGCG